MRLILTQARTGKTCVILNCSFVNGVHEVIPRRTPIKTLRHFGAFPEGSMMLRKQQEKDADNPELQEMLHGTVQDPPEPTGSDDGAVQPGESGHSEQDDHDGADDPAGEDGLGVDAEGHGAAIAGLSAKDQATVLAISKLDPLDDSHWTLSGQPAMDAVETFAGDTSITRADVDRLAPGLRRPRPTEE